ncbi:MAG: glycosyltransferase family 4 protein [Lachnospiraceae bacterium]|nr:glycosyltransferase family 4 protein [Lachnospiraceae bacterium]
MKVLWICNIVIPFFANEFGIKSKPFVGWISCLFNALINKGNLELGFCFPLFDPARMKNGCLNNYEYYSFKFVDGDDYDEETVTRFGEILRSFEPDIVHIWGTEYPHSKAAMEACERLNLLARVIVDIQGLVSIYSSHYLNGIPDHYKTLKSGEFKTIEESRDSFFRRGLLETSLLKKAQNAFGRSDWDRACADRINKTINYYSCNRILRSSFYESAGKWNIAECERFSLFVGQASYPIKGFHYLLLALPDILAKYPHTHVYVAGENPAVNTAWGVPPYGIFINDLINELDLASAITFLGVLNEEEIVKQFLKAHLFVSSSVIENASNAISEAAMLGLPIVASYTGGIGNMLEDKKSAMFYQSDAPYMLAYYVKMIFSDDDLAMRLSEEAGQKMGIEMNGELVADKVINVYEEIVLRQKG